MYKGNDLYGRYAWVSNICERVKKELDIDCSYGANMLPYLLCFTEDEEGLLKYLERTYPEYDFSFFGRTDDSSACIIDIFLKEC